MINCMSNAHSSVTVGNRIHIRVKFMTDFKRFCYTGCFMINCMSVDDILLL